jgi:hypothetical protein
MINVTTCGKRSNTLALSSSKYSMEETKNFPSWLSGFTDGEGCFLISFNKNASFHLKLEVRPSFSIGQGKHRTSYKSQTHILKRIESYFKCGSVRKYKRDGMMKYEVRNLSSLCDIIIPHFEKYPLLTQKEEDFHKFKEICLMMRSNLHRNEQGLKTIIDLACDMNPSGTRKISKEGLLKVVGL